MRLLTFILLSILNVVSYSLTLTIGTSQFNPPFEVWNNRANVPYGYDFDFMNELCKRMNATCIFEPYIFDDLFDLLQNKKLDLVVASIIITKEREKDFLFSLPYLQSNAQYFTNSNSPIGSISDLEGKKIGIRSGTPYDELVRANNKNNTLVYYKRIEGMLDGLRNNEVDACLLDYQAATYWIANTSKVYKLVGDKIPIGLGYAIMANKNQEDLIQKINRIILQMQADGTYLKMYSQYF